MTLPTPKYDLRNFPDVYDPREDSYFFLDALEEELDFLKEERPTFILEVGSGSGIIITSLAKYFKGASTCFSTDINIEACFATKNTSAINDAPVHVCNMDLFGNFKSRLFDLVIFNPPYVVTDSEELEGKGLNRAWAGGCFGRKVIDYFLAGLSDVLTNRGVAYMIALKENNIGDIVATMNGFGFESVVVKDRKIPGEHLYVLKFLRTSEK